MTDAPAGKVYIVDDDQSLRRSLARLMQAHHMEAEVFDSAESFLASGIAPYSGCLVLDVHMPGLSGMHLQEALTRLGCVIPVIFLTGHGDIPMGIRAMKKGASDFLTKPVDEQILLDSIHNALKTNTLKHEQARRVADIRARMKTLTQREYEVMQHVISGELNKQIGGDLDIAEKTVKVHRARVMEKLGVESVAELVRLCIEAGVAPASGSVPPQTLSLEA